MAKRDIYLEAARRIAEGRERYACLAIDEAANCCGHYGHSKETKAFAAKFAPTPSEREEYDAIGCGWLASYSESAAYSRHVRVLALCLMAAMEEA